MLPALCYDLLSIWIPTQIWLHTEFEFQETWHPCGDERRMSEWVRQSRICHYVLLASAFLSPPVTMRAAENSLSLTLATHMCRKCHRLFFSKSRSFYSFCSCSSWCKVCWFNQLSTKRASAISDTSLPKIICHCWVSSKPPPMTPRDHETMLGRDTQVALGQCISLNMDTSQYISIHFPKNIRLNLKFNLYFNFR